MIKKNTQKLLLSVYRPGTTTFMVPRAYFSLITPELSESGLRSLLHQLETQKLLSVLRLAGKTTWSLTNQGHQLVEGLFPAFIPKKETWSVMLFLRPPKTDPAFRYLRRSLLDQNWLSLSRGAYLYFGELPASVQQECSTSYPASVLVFEVKKWQIGDFQELILSNQSVSTTLTAYSGVSSQITSLISSLTKLESMTDQQKKLYASLFDRFYLTLRKDFGLGESWYAQVSRPLFILRSFQTILTP